MTNTTGLTDCCSPAENAQEYTTNDGSCGSKPVTSTTSHANGTDPISIRNGPVLTDLWAEGYQSLSRYDSMSEESSPTRILSAKLARKWATVRDSQFGRAVAREFRAARESAFARTVAGVCRSGISSLHLLYNSVARIFSRESNRDSAAESDTATRERVSSRSGGAPTVLPDSVGPRERLFSRSNDTPGALSNTAVPGDEIG